MGEDQEVIKHMCKLCNKSFPCGRSLGGHMRSHVINSAEHDQAKKLHKKKLSSLISNGTGSVTNGSNTSDMGYGLRENPKKTCKFKDSSHEDTLLLDKLCKECGKGFQSWKALFGHMKCHSDKVSHNRTTTATLEGDSWTSANQKLVLDSQSDNENFAPNRKKRSRRGAKRYMATTTTTRNTNTTASSSISINASQNNNYNNKASTNVFENEQEQEEIAMCLMMLSRDVSQWGGLNSVGEASDNNSAFVEANLVKFSAKIGGKNSVCNGGIVKIKKLRNRKLNSTVLDIGDLKSKKFGASEVPGNGSEVKKVETQGGDFLGNTKVEIKTLSKENEFDDLDELVSSKSNSRKRKGTLNLLDPELGIGCSEELAYGTKYVQELYNKDSNDPKKSKFECTTCNKAFQSYQALGGHRAGHKKLRGCLGLIGCWENDIENTEPIDQEMVLMTGFSEKTAEPSSLGSKKMMSKGAHECPICFRVFSSGQALGGHKRSHLIAEAKSTQNSSIVIQEPVREIRDFLDLNMPAPVEEELSTISSTSVIGFKPWWIEGNHKHESFLGLLSS